MHGGVTEPREVNDAIEPGVWDSLIKIRQSQTCVVQ